LLRKQPGLVPAAVNPASISTPGLTSWKFPSAAWVQRFSASFVRRGLKSCSKMQAADVREDFLGRWLSTVHSPVCCADCHASGKTPSTSYWSWFSDSMLYFARRGFKPCSDSQEADTREDLLGRWHSTVHRQSAAQTPTRQGRSPSTRSDCFQLSDSRGMDSNLASTCK